MEWTNKEERQGLRVRVFFLSIVSRKNNEGVEQATFFLPYTAL